MGKDRSKIYSKIPYRRWPVPVITQKTTWVEWSEVPWRGNYSWRTWWLEITIAKIGLNSTLLRCDVQMSSLVSNSGQDVGRKENTGNSSYNYQSLFPFLVDRPGSEFLWKPHNKNTRFYCCRMQLAMQCGRTKAATSSSADAIWLIHLIRIPFARTAHRVLIGKGFASAAAITVVSHFLLLDWMGNGIRNG